MSAHALTGVRERGLDVGGAGGASPAGPLAFGLALAHALCLEGPGATAVVGDDALLAHASPLDVRRQRLALLFNLPFLKF